MKNIDRINLREEMTDIINNYGYWVVLRTSLPGSKCSCINPVTSEPTAQCTLCLGSGRAYIDQFTKCRRSRPIGVTQNIGGETRTMVGFANSPDHIFYFEYNMRPTVDDYVLEIQLDPNDQEPLIPIIVTTVYDISDVREMRADNGRVEYYSATAERQSWPEFEVG